MEMDSGMTLYEFNKTAMATQEPMTEGKVKEALEGILAPYIKETGGKYYMLLNNENHYYTLWDMVSRKLDPQFSERAAADIIDVILSTVGCLYSVARDENGAIEIWVKNYSDNELYVYYFFNYDEGVIVL